MSNQEIPFPVVPKTYQQFVLSLVIPTRNEAGNIEPLLTRIGRATWGLPIELIFVDDSTDNTPDVIRCLQERLPLYITLIARPPERRANGLGGAVVEGMSVAQAPWVCVIYTVHLLQEAVVSAGSSAPLT